MKTIGTMMLFGLLVIITFGIWAGQNMSISVLTALSIAAVPILLVLRSRGGREDQIMYGYYRVLCVLAFWVSTWFSVLFYKTHLFR